ncbi:MAG: cyclic nucleotide-binding domain-containing protein [Candidatus Cloacimonetes bacterium]|nr:cyclic nucleotide-binding domain-containing protein [Candidatus Cloacimonadota bacterium]
MGLFRKSNDESKFPVLKQVGFLQQLSGHERALFSHSLDRRDFRDGEWVFHQGFPQAVLFIVATGEVEIVLESAATQPAVLDTLGPASFFGETGLFIETQRTAGVRAKGNATLLAISQEDFNHFVQLNPRAGIKLLYGLGRRLSEMLARTNDRLLELGRETADGQPTG